jgi:hypothetical protein
VDPPRNQQQPQERANRAHASASGTRA